MLKKTCGLFLGLVVLAGSACVTPTHASSAQQVIMTYVQAGGATGAKEEAIVLYNNSPLSVSLDSWCVTNKVHVAFACFDPEVLEGWRGSFIVPAYGYVTIVSEEYARAHSEPLDYYSLVYSVTNQSSGSIVGSADILSLVDADQQVVVTRAWASTIPTGKGWLRMKLMTNPDIYAVNNEVSDWVSDLLVKLPYSSLEIVYTPNEPPEEEVIEEAGTETPATSLPPIITEVLPNPSGADAGAEYIELYNPNTSGEISLSAFRLRVGLNESIKWYYFPAGTTIPAQSYRALFNSQMGFTLVNTTGAVQLFRGDEAAGASVQYISPKDNQSWALINELWQYVSVPTPGAANVLPQLEESEVDEEGSTSTASQKPCASNQYRNPDTGRCKLVAAASAAPAACKVGQERNPETGRCRSVTGASTSPAPCKEGQERNPETNRCRAIVKMTNVDYKVQDVIKGADNQPSWYYWIGIAGVVVLVLGYAVWEWREELRGAGKRLKSLVRK